MSYKSGWNKLAQDYKTDLPPVGDLLYEQNGKLGEFGFKRALNISVSEQSLYLSTNPIVNFFNMPPLLIPWDAVTHVRENNDNFFGEGYELYIGTPTITTLILPKKVLGKADAILATKQ